MFGEVIPLLKFRLTNAFNTATKKTAMGRFNMNRKINLLLWHRRLLWSRFGIAYVGNFHFKS